MTEVTWEKTADSASVARSYLGSRAKYMAVGFALLAIVGYLVISGTATGRYYITVEELVSQPNMEGKNVRVAGAVIGDTIRFDQATGTLSFTVANIPSDSKVIREAGGLGQVLYLAANDPNATQMKVVWHNAEMPDLLQHEAQAIMSGRLNADGTFTANEVLLKCPTRYSDEVPVQATTG